MAPVISLVVTGHPDLRKTPTIQSIMKKLPLIAAATLAAAFGTIHAASASDTAAAASHENVRGKIRALVSDVAHELLNFREQAPLSDGQRTEVRDILKSHKAEIAAQFQKGKDARRAMIEAVAQKGPDSPEALKAADAIGESARSRALLTGRVVSEITPLLTPEQKTLAKSALERIEGKVDGLFSEVSE
jgi:Spy/CpxP family protein refolding chaperone